MDINNTHPWIQLGYDDIYVCYPGQSTWKILFDEADDKVSWAAHVSISGGQEFLRQPGQKLGLQDNDAGKQLDQFVLEQLFERVGDQAILFAPPRQVKALQGALQDMATPPYAITLDSRLMSNIAPISIHDCRYDSETNIYLFDWNNTNQGIIRQFIKEQKLIFDACPLPVLMTAKAYASGKAEILSYYQGESGLGASTATLQIPQPAYQDTRQLGLGLVWAWGFGVRMWQWALKPRALPTGSAWLLECEPPNIIRVIVEGEQHEWTLSEPVMEKYF